MFARKITIKPENFKKKKSDKLAVSEHRQASGIHNELLSFFLSFFFFLLLLRRRCIEFHEATTKKNTRKTNEKRKDNLANNMLLCL